MTGNDDNPADLPEATQQAEKPVTDSAVDSDSERKKSERARSEYIEAREFWMRVFKDPVGQREMWKILQSGHCFEERFECGPNGFPQPEATWFRAGEQSIVQRIYQMWTRVDRDGVFRMFDNFHPEYASKRSKSGV